MKTLSLAIISAAIVLASCSSSKHMAASDYDDVYYNPNEAVTPSYTAAVSQAPAVTSQDAMSAQAINQQQNSTKSVAVADENLSDYEIYKLQQEAEMLGQAYTPEGSEALYAEQYIEYDTLGQYGQEGAPVIVNNYNYYSDPTDYYYSSNLRRFSDNYYGWNYYDPYYTDMYWYTGSPFSWGISMGWGYPGWGMGFSYGNPYRPYYGYGYGGWYDPWYSYGYGGYYGGYYPYYGGSYWAGYNHGWNNGYYYGSGGAYYPEQYYRYGHLDSRHSAGYAYRSREVTGSAKGSTAGDPRYRSRTSSSATASSVKRSNTVNTSTATRSQARTGSANTVQRQVRTNTVQQNNNGAVRTTRTTPAITAQPRTSTSSNQRGAYTPSYSKPRTTTSSSYNRNATPTRTYSQPATQQRSSTTIQRSTPARTSSPAYSRPSSSSRSSSSYSRPSSPSRSSTSYSRSSSGSSGSVSRSSGSVSRSSSSSSGSVSRSSGSSGSRSSGSSGSSGGGSRSSGSSSRR